MTTMTTMTTTEPLHLTDLIFEDQRIRQSRALNPYRDVLDYSLPTTTRFYPSRIMFHRTRIVRIERTLQERIAFENKRREDQAQADTAICEAFASSKDVNECAITLMPLTHWSQVAVTLPCRHLFEWNNGLMAPVLFAGLSTHPIYDLFHCISLLLTKNWFCIICLKKLTSKG